MIGDFVLFRATNLAYFVVDKHSVVHKLRHIFPRWAYRYMYDEISTYSANVGLVRFPNTC